MTTLPPRITAGVDTHLDVHVAAALDDARRAARRRVVRDDTGRLPALLAWLRGFGEVELVGVEGTGSYGAGLTRYLHARGGRGRRGRPSQPPTPTPARQERSPRRHHRGPCRAVRRRARRGQDQRRKRRGHAGSAGRPLLGPQGPDPGAQPDAQPHLHRARRRSATELRHLNVYRLLERASAYRPGSKRDLGLAHQVHAADCWPDAPLALEAEVAELDAILEPLVADTAPELVARLGHRHRHRIGVARRRRRQPRAAPQRSDLRPPLRRVAHRRQQRQTGTPPPQPRR